MKLRELIIDGLFLAGALLFSAGAYYQPAVATLVGGVALMRMALVLAVKGRADDFDDL